MVATNDDALKALRALYDEVLEHIKAGHEVRPELIEVMWDAFLVCQDHPEKA